MATKRKRRVVRSKREPERKKKRVSSIRKKAPKKKRAPAVKRKRAVVRNPAPKKRTPRKPISKKRAAPKPKPKPKLKPKKPVPHTRLKPKKRTRPIREFFPSFAEEDKAELRAKRKAEAAAKKKLRKPLRGEGGKFVSPKEFEEQRAIRRVRKVFKPLIAEEKKAVAKAYGITDKKKRLLDRSLKKMQNAALDSNFDLLSDLQPTLVVDGVRWEGAFSLTGFPAESEIPTVEERKAVEDMMVNSVFAVMDAFPKKRRGWLISLGMLSTDAQFLMYARKKAIFENRFLRLDDPREIGMVVQKLRELLSGMSVGRFAVSGLRVQFVYDHQVAKMGYDKAMRAARRKAGLKD